MRAIFLLPVIALSYNLAFAGFIDDMRQIRGSINEVSRTAKVVKSVGNALTPEEKQNSRNAIQPGDVITGKIANIKIFMEPSKSAAAISTLGRNEEVVFTGELVNGFYSVSTPSNVDGWVDKLLIKKR
jgi:hypothetical protein